jgi:hypothetical protein
MQRTLATTWLAVVLAATAGMVSPGHTCGDWKSTAGIAQIGHSDNRGPLSWTESHPSQGCTMAGVAAGGGNGRF